jgi:anti-sigma regulatory factor (Ser/Thr protein kinase)
LPDLLRRVAVLTATSIVGIALLAPLAVRGTTPVTPELDRLLDAAVVAPNQAASRGDAGRATVALDTLAALSAPVAMEDLAPASSAATRPTVNLQAELRAVALAAGLSPKTAAQLVYVVEEIGSNILVHSNAHWMELRFAPDADGWVLTLLDDGDEFDPVDAAKLMDEPVISEHVTGHLGLWTLKRMPFEQSWRRVGGVNELRFRAARP